MSSSPAAGTDGVRGYGLGRGWLPAHLVLNPVLPWVTWMHFGPTPLSEPLFVQSVSTRAASGNVDIIRSSIDSIGRMMLRVDTNRPSGFIFHISRAGSTAICNVLKRAEHVTVLSEPQPLCILPLPYQAGVWPCTATEFPSTQRELLRSVLHVLAHRRRHGEMMTIVKFTSWNTLFMSLVRSVWPDVPVLLVIRNPLDVVLSNLHSPTGWMSYQRSAPGLAASLFGFDATWISPVEYAARAVGALCRSALIHGDARCATIVYERLNGGSLREIANFFGITFTPQQWRAALDAMTIYSKDAQGSRPWAARSSPLAADMARDVNDSVASWAAPWFNALAARSNVL